MVYGGYVGKILRVDLSTGSITTLNTLDYVPEFIGGMGMSYKLLWDETNENTTEWSPENPIIFSAGPCAGTPIPSAGRAEVVGLAPEGYPKPWAAPSGFGGDFGPKMKFAGYDAIIITGKAETPRYLFVSEEKVEILDAEDCWGLNVYPAQDYFAKQHGDDIAAATIGPAGENLCRWAAIISRTENGAGQGGFGAVMGDKKLKGVVVKPGTVKVPIANPDKMIEVVNRLNQEMSPTGANRVPLFADQGSYSSRRQSCAWGACSGGIAGCLPTYWNKVPEVYGSGAVSGVRYCASGFPAQIVRSSSFEEQFEIKRLEEQLGLNHWESQLAIGFFLQNCYDAGILTKLMGETVPVDADGKINFEPEFVHRWYRAVARREGEGDVWAESTPRAAEVLGLESQIWKTHKHGYGPHWDGRYLQFVRSPVWIVCAVGCATKSRDPFNHQHGYPERYPRFVSEWRAPKTSHWGTPTIPYSEICELGAQLYGAEHANSGWDNPALSYTDKEYTALWHEYRSVIKDSVPMCDRQFPLLYDTLSTPAKVGWIDAETQAFNAVVGTDWTLAEMHSHCAKVRCVARAIQVRQGRTRDTDESVIPYFTQPDDWPDDPAPSSIEPVKFRALLDRYYALVGWDKTTGWPTRAHLEDIGLKDIADGLGSIGKLP